MIVVKNALSVFFFLLLLKSIDSNKKVTITVPEEFRWKFEIIVEKENMTNISIAVKDKLSLMAGSPMNRFFDSNEYTVCDSNFKDDLVMKKTDMNKMDAKAVIER